MRRNAASNYLRNSVYYPRAVENQNILTLKKLKQVTNFAFPHLATHSSNSSGPHIVASVALALLWLLLVYVTALNWIHIIYTALSCNVFSESCTFTRLSVVPVALLF